MVVTVMTNLGFRLAMADAGHRRRETPVGDRHVLAALDAEGLALGGEQSGHIVFRHRATTGDGILTGLLLADLVARSGRPLAELVGRPGRAGAPGAGQRGRRRPGRLEEAEGVWAAVAEAEPALGDQRAGAAAPERHRAPGPGHGGGGHSPAGRDHGRAAAAAVMTWSAR